MKTVKNIAAQGDLFIRRVDEIPMDAKLAVGDGQFHIVAHSETGHHHVIERARAKLYQRADDEFIAWLEVEIGADVEHQRSFDTHETLHLPPGKYEIRRQREYVAEGFRRAAD